MCGCDKERDKSRFVFRLCAAIEANAAPPNEDCVWQIQAKHLLTRFLVLISVYM